MNNVQDGKQKVKTAADVIAAGVRAAPLARPMPLRAIASEMGRLALELELGAPEDSKLLYLWAGELQARHDHGDPCDDTACPCRKAEADDWRDQGLARP